MKSNAGTTQALCRPDQPRQFSAGFFVPAIEHNRRTELLTYAASVWAGCNWGASIGSVFPLWQVPLENLPAPAVRHILPLLGIDIHCGPPSHPSGGYVASAPSAMGGAVVPFRKQQCNNLAPPAFLVKARRMPRQAQRKKRQNRQEKTKKSNRLGSCNLLAKQVSALSF